MRQSCSLKPRRRSDANSSRISSVSTHVEEVVKGTIEGSESWPSGCTGHFPEPTTAGAETRQGYAPAGCGVTEDRAAPGCACWKCLLGPWEDYGMSRPAQRKRWLHGQEPTGQPHTHQRGPARPGGPSPPCL